MFGQYNMEKLEVKRNQAVGQVVFELFTRNKHLKLSLNDTYKFILIKKLIIKLKLYFISSV